MKKNIMTSPDIVIQSEAKNLPGYRSSMRFLIAFGMTMIILLAACTPESDGEPPLPGFPAEGININITIPALSPPATTRATLPPGMKTAWKAGDRVYMRILFLPAGSPTEPQLVIAEYDATGTWVFDSVITPPAGATEVSIMASYAGADALQSTTIALSDAFGAITLNPFTHQSTLVYFTGLNKGDVIELGNGSTWHTFTIDPETYRLISNPTTRLYSYTVTNPDGTAEIYAEIYPATADGNAYFRVIPAGGTESDASPWVAIESVSRAGGDWYTINCSLLFAGDGGVDINNLDRELFLAWAERVRAGETSLNFTLTGHIDLTGQPNWVPLPEFAGTFDGAGYSITGLTVNTNNRENTGLFNSIMEKGTVKNLHLRSVDIKAGNERTYTGGISGRNYGTITGCTVQGTIRGILIGAIAGDNGGTITACAGLDTYLIGNNNATSAGGIAAYNSRTIVGCYSTAKQITASPIKNGIARSDGNNSVITSCYWLPVTGMPADDFPNFTSAADLYAKGFMTAMNDGLDAYNDNPNRATPYRWKSNTNDYPTINRMKP